MGSFYIVNVDIQNFRGYTQLKQPFNFRGERQNSKVVLLSGGNGFGKTSLLDAIEWCFTGTIFRIESDFRSRYTTQESRNTEKANKGLLRNRSGEGNQVSVKIDAIYKSKKIIISREFNGNLDSDGFNVSLPVVECDDSSVKDSFIEHLQILIEKFNDTYVCSYDKNIELYSKGRNEIYEMFSCFYKDHVEAKKIVKNLEEVKEKLEVEKKEVDSKLTAVQSQKNNSMKIAESVKSIINNNLRKEKYPEIKIYNEENIDPLNWTSNGEEDNIEIENKIQEQIDRLSDIKLGCIKNGLGKYKFYLASNVKLVDYKKIKEEYEKNINLIKMLSNRDIDGIEQDNEIIQEKLKKISGVTTLEQLEQNYANINLDVILTNEAKREIGTKIFDLRNNHNEIAKLNKEAELYDTSNEVLKSVRLILDNIEGFNKYRESNKRCPLCGSEDEFLKSELGSVAKQYLGEQDKERQKLNKMIEDLSNKNKKILKDTIIFIEGMYKEILDTIKLSLVAKETCKSFLNLCKKYSIDYKLVDDKFLETSISEILNSLETNHFDINKELELINLILAQNYTIFATFKDSLSQNEFGSLSYADKFNLINGLFSNVEKYMKSVDRLSEQNVADNTALDISDLDKRINICTFIKSNIQLTKVNEEVNKNIKLEEATLKRVTELINQIDKTSTLVKKIKKLIKTSEVEQAERIAEPLDKIYRKITRNTNIKRIKFERAKTQNPNAELKIIDCDNKESQFANILSAGQLSTLAISIFLSKAMLNRESDIRCYFMDEPIQTMDDLNILSFVDLLRFQLNNKQSDESFIDQIFISTCDSDLEKLIIHKMSSFKVPICEYRFEGPNNYIRNFID